MSFRPRLTVAAAAALALAIPFAVTSADAATMDSQPGAPGAAAAAKTYTAAEVLAGVKKNSVEAVACTNLDGRPIAVTTGRDNTARAWDIATNAEMAIFDFRAISAAAIRSSGELMIAAGWDFIVFDRTARH